MIYDGSFETNILKHNNKLIMVFISATRLRVKSILSVPGFIIANEACVKQLIITGGYLRGRELIDKNLVFWTLTLWESDGNMKDFRNSPSHRKAMQKLSIWCDEATFIHWTQEENQLPEWKIVFEKMLMEGIISKVRNPFKNHLSRNFPGIRWKFWKEISNLLERLSVNLLLVRLSTPGGA